MNPYLEFNHAMPEMTTLTATQCARNITTFRPTLPHDEHVGGKRPLTEGYAYPARQDSHSVPV
jgi:hypothetical protein